MVRRNKGVFKSVEERQAVLFGHIAEVVNKDLPPPTVDELLERHEAMEFLRRRLAENPRNTVAHHLMAPLIRTTNDLKKAVQHYMCSTTYNPMDLDAMVDLADILYKSGSATKALALLQRVIEVNPDHILANKNIGAVYAHFAKYRDALRHSERAALLNPMDPMIHRNIAKLRNVMGNSIDAVKHNRVAIRLGPGVDAVSERGDYRAYRALSLQLTSTGQRETGFAQEHYDAYRALAGKRFTLALSERTKEILEKTHTKA